MTYRAAGAANKSQLRRREEENNPLTIGLLWKKRHQRDRWFGLGLLGTPGTHWYPLVPTGTHWYPLIPTGTHWYPLIPTGTHWYPLVLLVLVLVVLRILHKFIEIWGSKEMFIGRYCHLKWPILGRVKSFSIAARSDKPGFSNTHLLHSFCQNNFVGFWPLSWGFELIVLETYLKYFPN